MKVFLTFLKGLIGLAIIAAIVFFGGAQVLPDKVQAERHVVISAPPEKVFEVVGNIRRFNEWSPWADLDPVANYKFEGPEQGPGQKMSWTSNVAVLGAGSVTYTNVKDNVQIDSDIELAGQPKGKAVMSIAQLDKGTGVTWSYETPVSGYLQRWANAFRSPAIEGDLGKGLRKLKMLLEKIS